MVRKEKQGQALHAFNGVLVLLRRWAYLKEDSGKIATVLDIVEQLPRFIGTNEDQTEDFEESLISLAKAFPEMGIGLELFRREQAPDAW